MRPSLLRPLRGLRRQSAIAYRFFMRKLLLTCVVFAWVAGLVAAEAPTIPLEDFFESPAILSPRLSDDGNRLVMLVRGENGKRSIATFDFATGVAKIVFVPNDYDVEYAFWKGDRIVFGGQVGGNESRAMRSIKADGSGLVDLSESYQKYKALDGAAGASILSQLQDDPENVLVLGYGAERDHTGRMSVSGDFGVYRLNVRNGRRELVEGWGTKDVEVMVDERTGLVYGRVRQSGAVKTYELRLTGSNRFVEVARTDAAGNPWAAEGLLADGKHLVVMQRGLDGYDRGALLELDMVTGKSGKVLFEPPTGEIDGVVMTNSGELAGVKYVDQFPHYRWFLPRWEQLYAGLSATFRGEFVQIVDTDRAEKKFVVIVTSDRNPGAYYFYDSAKNHLAPLGKVYPKIDPAKMAGRHPFTFTARDGLKIQGYLTIPPGREKQPNPMILHPHGGPFGIRDDWEFDDESQFYASRGYTVMQVNYRGSGGYGDTFMRAGMKQWGRTMQDDLTDAVDWAIAQKLTTPDKVAIVGASYGGYAVLAGLVYTPEKYCLGINYVGVSDLRILVDPKTREIDRSSREWYKAWIGSNPDDLKAQSPVEFVERIQVPLMNAYGENDPRVDIEHWRRLEHELKKYNKQYYIFREGDEGHGFRNETSRIRFYRAVEEFLRTGFSGQALIGESKLLEMPVGTPAKD